MAAICLEHGGASHDSTWRPRHDVTPREEHTPRTHQQAFVGNGMSLASCRSCR
jgi:hypothetical protein